MRTILCSLLIAAMFACTSPSPSSDPSGSSQEGESEAEGEGEGVIGPNENDAELLEVHETDEPCTETSDCETSETHDPCRDWTCNGAGYCTYTAPDQDEDGAALESCGGSDCDDREPRVPGNEDCDGVDNNCDGATDNDLVEVACPNEEFCGSAVATRSCIAFESGDPPDWSACPAVMEPCSLTGDWNIDVTLEGWSGSALLPLTITTGEGCPPFTITGDADYERPCTGSLAASEKYANDLALDITCTDPYGQIPSAIAHLTATLSECGDLFSGQYTGESFMSMNYGEEETGWFNAYRY